MSPPPRSPRDLALEITRRVARGAFSSVELDRALRESDLAARDRALVTDLTYGALRYRLWLDAALAPLLRDPEGLPDDVREALRLGAYERLVRGTAPHAAVGEWVQVVRARRPRLHGLVNAVLRRVQPASDLPDATRLSLPTWLWRRVLAALSEDAEEAVRGMQQPAPLWLTAYRDDAARLLREEGSEVADGPLPGTLRVRPGVPLARLAAYREGAVQPQNPSSAWVARAADVGPGTRVLDLCCGAGIKSAQFAAAGAEVEAYDLSERKIARGRANLERLGLAVDARAHDLRTAPPGARPAGRVVLDAPCSGTGTLRGHPEIPLRLREEDLAPIAALQDALLDTAASLTAAGGVLTYAVCALTPEEGPERVGAFLARHPSFEPLVPACPLPHRRSGGGAFVLPRNGLDGFFVARLANRATRHA